jgi:hypothetical protein
MRIGAVLAITDEQVQPGEDYVFDHDIVEFGGRRVPELMEQVCDSGLG